ncbi:MAG TPA: HipA domain-containing protein [Elusimicrobiota bacterium]|nr:HipA domain-containing protein [Elusimicrobiota bacterium]
MANCLCCQEDIEGEERYHSRCIKKLFGTTWAPTISFSVSDMPSLVEEAKGHISISGVQMKVSVQINEEKRELESVSTGGTHILKPEPDRFPEIPQNENLCMNMAESLDMRVPPHGLLPMADGKLCYVVKRFDRADDGTKIPNETMFQILGSTDKYKGSLEQIGRALRAHTTNVGLDTVDFFERVLLCFLIGNGDMHMKNWALLGQGKEIGLAPVYDFVSSRLYIKNEEDSALTIHARKSKLTRDDFEAFATVLTIAPRAAQHVFDKLKMAQDTLRLMVIQSELRNDLRQDLAAIISARYKRLFPKGE